MLRAFGAGVREIARRLGRSPSTISRELRRNAATRSGGFEYPATSAQWHADRGARRPKPAKLVVDLELRDDVQEELSGRCGGLTASPSLARSSAGSVGARPSRGPSVGEVVESGADLQPAADRLPR